MKRLGLMALAALLAMPAAIVAVPLAVGSSVTAAAAARSIHPTKVMLSSHDVSAPLRDAAGVPAVRAEDRYEANKPVEGEGEGEGEGLAHNLYPSKAPESPATGVQTAAPGKQIPAPIVSFDGISNTVAENASTTVRPPDPNSDVGPNHIVEVVNLSIAVYDKLGNVAAGFPKRTNALWAGFTAGTQCRDNNDGDPTVNYDQLADRWLVTQFALPNFPSGPYFQCIAVSSTPDPTGNWNRYQFQYPVNRLNDYPKFGVWPDGYYASFNEFTPPTFSFHGAGVIAYDRANMIAGNPATAVYFDVATIDPNTGGLLPSNLQGTTPPPVGSPNYFVDQEYKVFGYPADRLQLWKFHADFAVPANSTFTGPTVLTPTPFGPTLCGFSPCVPQPSTAVKLDTLSDRVMNRLNYRNFGDHESLVVNHTINVGTSGAPRAGVRWYELRSPNASPTIFQEGTFAPADGLNRWMGSVNMDKNGNLAVGYSVGNSTTFPGIRYAGRLVGDPAGQLTQGEGVIVNGGGSQTSSEGRWGDYSSLSIDPSDDCTFWYTMEYLPATSFAGWTTQIASFKFAECGATELPTLSINNKSVTEGAAGTSTNVVFLVTLSAASTQAVTFTAMTADGTATTADNDYVAINKVFTIPAGATSVKVKVKVNGDATVEPTETFFVNLSSPVNATIADGQGRARIINDD